MYEWKTRFIDRTETLKKKRTPHYHSKQQLFLWFLLENINKENLCG